MENSSGRTAPRPHPDCSSHVRCGLKHSPAGGAVNATAGGGTFSQTSPVQ